jgi:hypothetical protein
MGTILGCFWFGLKILVKLDVFTTHLVNGLSVEVKGIDYGFRIDETSRGKHQVLEELIFILEIQILNHFLVEEVFGKFWNLERIKFVFN